MTTASGSRSQTWRRARGDWTRPAPCSIAASGRGREDLAVRLARLDWAQASRTARRGSARRRICPRPGFSHAQVLALRAWLAARSGDRRGERSALEELIALEPDQAAALERLADLAAQDGESERVAELRRRKAAADAARDRYHVLVNCPDLASHAAELGRAALEIDRQFDARMWWSLAAQAGSVGRGRGGEVCSSGERGAGARGRRGTLADLLGPVDTWRGENRGCRLERCPSIQRRGRSTRGLVFTFDNGQSDHRHLPETMSGGVALLDFDGDGWLDVYAVQGGRFHRQRIDGRHSATGSSATAATAASRT